MNYVTNTSQVGRNILLTSYRMMHTPLIEQSNQNIMPVCFDSELSRASSRE
ncbi:MAG: hypothetical protein U5Q03_16040 [Bacteroidota bacterium]|nr:hypothetical protein [Bacteroidota bacterium]